MSDPASEACQRFPAARMLDRMRRTLAPGLALLVLAGCFPEPAPDLVVYVAVDRAAVVTTFFDRLGVQYGPAAWLEAMGVRFFHPYRTYVPAALSAPAAGAAFGQTAEPEIPMRGLHLYTLHPIEVLYDFWMPVHGVPRGHDGRGQRGAPALARRSEEKADRGAARARPEDGAELHPPRGVARAVASGGRRRAHRRARRRGRRRSARPDASGSPFVCKLSAAPSRK